MAPPVGRKTGGPMKKQYKPKLDPQVDLVGATPEALVRALFRRVEPLPPRPAGEPVVGDQPQIGQGTPPKPDKDSPHLVDGI